MLGRQKHSSGLESLIRKCAFTSYENPSSLIMVASCASLVAFGFGSFMIFRTRQAVRKNAFTELTSVCSNMRDYVHTGKWKPIGQQTIYLIGLITCFLIAFSLGSLPITDFEEIPPNLLSKLPMKDLPQAQIESPVTISSLEEEVQEIEELIGPDHTVAEEILEEEKQDCDLDVNLNVLLKELMVNLVREYPLVALLILVMVPTIVFSSFSHTHVAVDQK